MSLDLGDPPPWLATVLLAEDDTEESVPGSDWHQQAIHEAHATLLEYAEAIGSGGAPAWYVSSQVTVIVPLPRRSAPWHPKPDLFVVPGVAARSRTSYDTRMDGPMPPFVLEVASESTWRADVAEKAELYRLAGVREYLVFDAAREFLGEPARGWHLTSEGWGQWQAVEQAAGQHVWQSTVLGLALRVEGVLLRFDHPERGALPVRRDLRMRLAQEEAARRIAEERAAQEQAARQTAEERMAQEQAARRAAEERAARLDRELRDARSSAERPPASGPEE